MKFNFSNSFQEGAGEVVPDSGRIENPSYPLVEIGNAKPLSLAELGQSQLHTAFRNGLGGSAHAANRLDDDRGGWKLGEIGLVRNVYCADLVEDLLAGTDLAEHAITVALKSAVAVIEV
jgi:hypothetical protein